MSNLLRAGVRRYLRNIVFWLAIVTTIVAAVICAVNTRQLYFDDFYCIVFFQLSEEAEVVPKNLLDFQLMNKEQENTSLSYPCSPCSSFGPPVEYKNEQRVEYHVDD